MKKNIKKIIKSVFILTLVSSWLLSGWPGIWLPGKSGESVRFPIEITEIKADSQPYTTGSGSFTPPFTGSYTITLVGGGGGGGGFGRNMLGGAGYAGYIIITWTNGGGTFSGSTGTATWSTTQPSPLSFTTIATPAAGTINTNLKGINLKGLILK